MWQSGLKAGSDVGRSLPRSPFAVSVVLGQPALTTGTEKCRSSWVPSRGEGQLPERSVQHRTRAVGLSGCGGTSLCPRQLTAAWQALVEVSMCPRSESEGMMRDP